MAPVITRAALRAALVMGTALGLSIFLYACAVVGATAPVIESWVVAVVFVGAVTLGVLRVAQRLDARERRGRSKDGPRWR